MRRIAGIVIVIGLSWACSTTEPVQTEIEEVDAGEPEAQVSGKPDWFDRQIFSSADSLAFYGYAMASATDSTEAAALSRETALHNLRFEIDRYAEEVRENLSDEGNRTPYSEPAFIIKLRNAVREMDLGDYEIEVEHEQTGEGLHYVYVRTELKRSRLRSLFSENITDARFLEKL